MALCTESHAQAENTAHSLQADFIWDSGLYFEKGYTTSDVSPSTFIRDQKRSTWRVDCSANSRALVVFRLLWQTVIACARQATKGKNLQFSTKSGRRKGTENERLSQKRKKKPPDCSCVRLCFRRSIGTPIRAVLQASQRAARPFLIPRRPSRLHGWDKFSVEPKKEEKKGLAFMQSCLAT